MIGKWLCQLLNDLVELFLFFSKFQTHPECNSSSFMDTVHPDWTSGHFVFIASLQYNSDKKMVSGTVQSGEEDMGCIDDYFGQGQAASIAGKIDQSGLKKGCSECERCCVLHADVNLEICFCSDLSVEN